MVHLSAGGGKKAILAALSANAGIAVAKFVGAAITGSASMLAEAVHSVADTSNQGLLLLGQRRAEQEADELHPFGYGRNRYFYSFVVALVIFALGSLYAIYEGIHKIQHPEELSNPIVAIVILGLAIALEGYSFTTAMRESVPLKGNASWWRFIRNSRNPELPVVLLEDSGALIGLIFAFAAITLSMVTGDPVWDGVGTLAIGILLGVIAVILIIEMQSLLIGEGATPRRTARSVRRWWTAATSTGSSTCAPSIWGRRKCWWPQRFPLSRAWRSPISRPPSTPPRPAFAPRFPPPGSSIWNRICTGHSRFSTDQRSRRRMTNRRPDQMSSTAIPLLSTRP